MSTQSPARKKGKSNGQAIPLGRKPADKRDAWHALTPQAKMKLLELRQGGRAEMGGTPGQAPYWASQEFGNEFAHIEARHYIAESLKAWRGMRSRLIAEFFKA